jgi:hypothetical protein
MATAIVELIAQNIATALATVTVANGYANTLIVERRKPAGNAPVRDGLAVLFQGDPEAGSGQPLQRREWRQPFHVLLCATQADSESGNIDARLNSLRADVEKVLLAAPNRGGYAVDTELQPPHFATNTHGDVEAVVVTVEVTYRTAWNDPYTQG